MTTHDDSQLLDDLARAYGIADHYVDIWGTRHEASEATKRAILTAMGVPVNSRAEREAALASLHARYWCRVCDPVWVLRGDHSDAAWSLRVRSREDQDRAWTIRWSLATEDGRVSHRGETGPGSAALDHTLVDGARYIRLALGVPAGLPMGYYRFAVCVAQGSHQFEGTSLLVVAPPACFVPPDLEAGPGTWGLWLQLYSLRSHRNWGVGDFTDLASMIRWAGETLGAGALGVNPLHALKNTRPYHISPYSPHSRGAVNEIYLDLEGVPEYCRCVDAQRVVAGEAFRSRLESFRKSEWVDYEGVHRAKLEVLELLYRQFVSDSTNRLDPGGGPSPESDRARAFARYCENQGESLDGFALFLALTEHFSKQVPAPVTWRDWPAEYLHPSSPAVAEFRRRFQDRIRFYQYVQWQAHEQLMAAARLTRELGMVIGLYHDFALGSDPSGAEGWLLQDVLVHGVDCGAPPDPFALQGQNWGFPPFHPMALRDQAYQPLITLLRQNLSRGGALRLDHVMGLFRLFWIPKGQNAATGAYVQYPFEDLLGILALESQRARTVVIGEDLGTVPDWIREKLAEICAFSYRVWYFERHPDGSWKAPDQYPVHSLAVTTTHDLPTLPGFWQHNDLHIRDRLGLFPDAEVRRRTWEERARDKARMLEALRVHGGWQGGARSADESQDLTPEVLDAVHRFLAKTSSLVVLASLDDWIGETAQANVPGTLDEYPNWSRKAAVCIEDLRDDPHCRRLAAVMRQERGSGRGRPPGS